MIQVSYAQIGAACPACRAPAVVSEALNESMERFGIAADRDFVCAFLAQLAVESNQFNAVRENLNYSAAGLMRTWPTRFRTLAFAEQYHRQPEKIANYVYANRLGNGPVESGDGWRYRGVGWIQCTGRTNIERALAELGLPPGDPKPLESPRFAALSAGAYWSRKPQLNLLADDLPNDDDVADFFSITRLVNGGTIGLAERREFWERFKAVIP